MEDRDKELTSLREQVTTLKEEVADRERDLSHFREELSSANSRIQALIQRMERELQLAFTIQRTLVPTEYPNIPGFEFSSKFVSSLVSGGDYFDIFEHEDRFRFGVIVASSTGHSMSALLLSVLLRMTGQLEARRGATPKQVVEGL